MSRIRSKDTKPELLVRKFLHGKGFRYRLSDKNLPGKPDIVLSKYKTVIFVHGCFWHGHDGCRYFIMPKTNVAYWRPKIESNIQRDRLAQIELERIGWKVIVVWECELKSDGIKQTLSKLIKEINYSN